MGTPKAATAGYAGQDAMTAQQLNEMYARQAPAGPVDTGRVTLDDVIIKSLALFVVTLAVRRRLVVLDRRPTRA